MTKPLNCRNGITLREKPLDLNRSVYYHIDSDSHENHPAFDGQCPEPQRVIERIKEVFHPLNIKTD
jgi:hypothetical protein